MTQAERAIEIGKQGIPFQRCAGWRGMFGKSHIEVHHFSDGSEIHQQVWQCEHWGEPEARKGIV